MNGPLILDTGGWLCALSGDRRYEEPLEEATSLLVPGLVLAELDHLLGRAQRREMHQVLEDVGSGSYEYHPPTVEDLVRARELDRKFKTVELGLVDATVAALAERLRIYRVLTTDSDFALVRIGARYDRSLEIVGGPFSQ